MRKKSPTSGQTRQPFDDANVFPATSLNPGPHFLNELTNRFKRRLFAHLFPSSVPPLCGDGKLASATIDSSDIETLRMIGSKELLKRAQHCIDSATEMEKKMSAAGLHEAEVAHIVMPFLNNALYWLDAAEQVMGEK